MFIKKEQMAHYLAVFGIFGFMIVSVFMMKPGESAHMSAGVVQSDEMSITGVSIVKTAPSKDVNALPFEVLSDKEVPEELRSMIETSHEARGVLVYQHKGKSYVYIGSGNVPASEHSIGMERVEREGHGEVIVTIREDRPSPQIGDLRFSPYTVIEIESTPSSIVVQTEAGKKLTDITNAILHP